jgi:hypothetical protein
MSAAKRTEGGTLLRGADGELYFIRDEMLALLRVQGEGLERMSSMLEDAKAKSESTATQRHGVQRLQYVSGDLLVDQPDREMPDLSAQDPDSTYMCPWFC